jgi:hypothetical protein
MLRKFLKYGADNYDLEKLKSVMSLFAPEVFKLLEQLNLNMIGDKYNIPNEWQTFFLCLASDSSLSNSFCKELFEILFEENLTNIINSPMLLKQLQDISPMIFNIITTIETIPNTFWDMLNIIKHKSLAFFDTSNSHNHTDLETNSNNFSYFEYLQKVRERGIYQADKTILKQRECRKRTGKGHPYLGPGTFTLFCAHGICYGYQMMQCQESPNIPFTVQKTRFKKGT